MSVGKQYSHVAANPAVHMPLHLTDMHKPHVFCKASHVFA